MSQHLSLNPVLISCLDQLALEPQGSSVSRGFGVTDTCFPARFSMWCWPSGHSLVDSRPSPQYFKPTSLVLPFPSTSMETVIQIRNSPYLANEWKWITWVEWKKESQQGDSLAGCKWRLTEGLGRLPGDWVVEWCGRGRGKTQVMLGARDAGCGRKAMLVRGEMGKAG